MRGWILAALLGALACGGGGSSPPGDLPGGGDEATADPARPDPGPSDLGDGEEGREAGEVPPEDLPPEVPSDSDVEGDADPGDEGDPDAEPPPTGPLRVMTFNLRTAFGDFDENAWDQRKARVADLVARHRPDLLGTQEGWVFQVEDLQAAVPGYERAGISRTGGDLEETCSVLWRADRFEAEDSGTFWLGPDPSDPATVFGPGQAYPRIATWVRLRPRDGSPPFLFLNTHLDISAQDAVREKSAALLARMAIEIGGGLPVVLTGDFNTGPRTLPWEILTGAAAWEGTRGDFTDSWVELGLPEAGTFHGFRGTSTGARIDWVMHRGGFRATEARILAEAAPDGLWPSDHFPVLAVLERADPPPPSWWAGLGPRGRPLQEMLGVSSHMAQGPWPDAERDFELARYAALGGVRVRNDFLWQWIEPRPGEFDFTAVEAGVDGVLASGGRVTAILDYGVGWAMPDGNPGSIDPEAFGTYAGALAGHFCGRIGDFEVWNEPNLDLFWPPVPDPARYGALLRAAHRAVKAACPGARVLVGGMAPVDMMLEWPFLRELGQAWPDLCDHFDVLAIHPYTVDQGASPEMDVRLEGGGYLFPGQAAMTAMARDRLAEWGCPDRPIQFTEMGWPSYTVSEEDQGRWLARSFLLAARDGVEGWFWYTFWDGEPTTTGPRPHENYFGLFGWPFDPVDPRRPKPSWRAFEALATVLGEARFARDASAMLGLPDDVSALAFLREDGGLLLAAWDGRDMPDVGPDGVGPGGPGTTHELALSLPPGTRTVRLWRLDGTPPEDRDPSGSLTLRLEPTVQVVEVPGGSAR